MQEYTSLYRQLRPSRFADIIGQPHVSRVLINALTSGRVSHAYLFSGPRGTGKTTTAKIMAKAVNCHDHKNGEPCNQCASCLRIGRGYSLDVVEIDGASNRGIDEIRDLREKVRLAPAEETHKVYIIDEVHMLTGEAFNALLKTLEEPPARTMFILATTEPHKMPETILSRCQRFDFRRIGQEEIQCHLQKVLASHDMEADPPTLMLIAKMARGGLRDALSILEQCIAFCGGDELTPNDVETVLGKTSDYVIRDLLQAVITGDVAGALTITNETLTRGSDIGHLFNDIIEYLRHLLVLKTTKNGAELIPYGADILSVMNQQSETVTTSQLFKMIEEVSRYEQQLRWSNQPQVILELAVIKICGCVLPVEDEEVLPVLKGEKHRAVNSAVEPRALHSNSQTACSQGDHVHTDAADEVDQEDNLTLNIIKVEWKKILDKVKKTKVSLHAVLVEGSPALLDNNVLTITFPSKMTFHKETAEQGKNKEILENVLKEFFPQHVRVRFVLEDERTSGGKNGENVAPDEKPLKELAQDIFGGEIINLDEVFNEKEGF